MPRIKLALPAFNLASIEVPVRITDVNYGGHVGNDAFVSIIHEARMQWLAKHGFSEMDFAGVSLIMSDLAVEFKQEAFYGDMVLIKIGIGEVTRVSFELYYELSTLRDNVTVLLCKAKTGMVCYDYEIKKTVSVPDKVLMILAVH
jgi:YbgC/YbaW family acyl-CoA thioester hydrolase